MANDLYWTLDGDLNISETGDLRDTSYDENRSLWQEIRTRCQSSFRDWFMHPNLGANLYDLLGNPNNKTTAEEGKTRIIGALIQSGFLPREVIRVRYLPMGRQYLVYDIAVMVSQSRTLKVQMVYDTEESSLRVI